MTQKYDRLFERFELSQIARYYGGGVVRQSPQMLFRLSDVVEVCERSRGVSDSREIFPVSIESIRSRFGLDRTQFVQRFVEGHWEFWGSLKVCRSMMDLPRGLEARMKVWEADRSGTIDRYC
jgi:hypothetical protein